MVRRQRQDLDDRRESYSSERQHWSEGDSRGADVPNPEFWYIAFVRHAKLDGPGEDNACYDEGGLHSNISGSERD